MVLRFRTFVLLGVAGLVLLFGAATVASITTLIDRRARVRLEQQLDQSREVFDGVQAMRRDLLHIETRVVGEEPRLKAVVATADVTAETTRAVAAEMQRILGSDLFVLTDATGAVRARLGAEDGPPELIAAGPLIAGAMADGEAAGLWTIGDRVYLAASRRLSLRGLPIGTLVLGHRIREEVTRSVHQQTGGTVLVALAGRLLTGSGPATGRVAAAELARVVGALPLRRAVDHAAAEVVLDGERFLGFAAPLDPAHPEEAASGPRFAILLSLDEALAGGSRFKLAVIVISGVVVGIGLLFSLLLGSRLGRPLEDLADVARRIGGGDLAARARPGGPREVRELGAAMNHMVEALAAAQDERRLAEERERSALIGKLALAREVDLARGVQQALMPGEDPVERPGLRFAGRWQPASRCGGDWWTYRILPAGKTLLVIGDVTGHGIDSAMITATAKAACDVAGALYGDAGLSAARLLEVMNRAVHDTTHGSLLMTCFAAIVDVHARRVAFANAGHEFPLVLGRAPGRVMRTLACSGDPLGARADTTYEEASAPLEPGDTLVLFTDGLIELRSPDGVAFGEKRLRRAVERHIDGRPEALLGAVLSDAGRFAGGTEQADDIALVVARVEATPEPDA